MVRGGATPEVIHDSARSSTHGTRRRGFGNEWRKFMSPNIADMYGARKVSAKQTEKAEEEMDIRKLLKDVEFLGTSTMTWKERKALQNENAVALGGKPQKKHRTPLSVAIPAMKNQKKREQKKIEEERILGQFVRRGNTNKKVQKRPEDRALKASEGHFSRGILNVKHILEPKSSQGSDGEPKMTRNRGKKNWKGKGKGKGKKGKRKGH